MKRAFKIKQKAFPISFKGLSMKKITPKAGFLKGFANMGGSSKFDEGEGEGFKSKHGGGGEEHGGMGRA